MKTGELLLSCAGTGVRVPEDQIIDIVFHFIPSMSAYTHSMRPQRPLCRVITAISGRLKRRGIAEELPSPRETSIVKPSPR